jgi:uncharacterized membrane protein
VDLRPAPDSYVTMYILDSNKKAENYPELLVAGVNSTFTVWFGVENHLGYSLNNPQVEVKITTQSNPSFPLAINANQTILKQTALSDGKTWEDNVTISLDQPGNYLISFELWKDPQTFLEQFNTLSIRVSAP